MARQCAVGLCQPLPAGHKRKNWFLGAEVFEAEASPDGSPLRDSDLRFRNRAPVALGVSTSIKRTLPCVRRICLPARV
jgi:hypothetical protein